MHFERGKASGAAARNDPLVFANEVDQGDHGARGEPSAHEVVSRHTVDELLGFLRSILQEIRSKRHDMVTHHNVDDLRVTLGFAREGKSDEEVTPSMDESCRPRPHSHGKSQAENGGPAPESEPDAPPNAPPSHGDF
jgi:hypothetical protein